MKHIQVIETILYVNDRQASANFYQKIFTATALRDLKDVIEKEMLKTDNNALSV